MQTPPRLAADGAPATRDAEASADEAGASYGVSFTYRAEAFYAHFGGEWEAWEEERAEEEQRFDIEKVERGEWTLATARPALTARGGDRADVSGRGVAMASSPQARRQGPRRALHLDPACEALESVGDPPNGKLGL